MYNRNADFVITFLGVNITIMSLKQAKKKKEFFRTPSGKDPLKFPNLLDQFY